MATTSTNNPQPPTSAYRKRRENGMSPILLNISTEHRQQFNDLCAIHQVTQPEMLVLLMEKERGRIRKIVAGI